MPRRKSTDTSNKETTYNGPADQASQASQVARAGINWMQAAEKRADLSEERFRLLVESVRDYAIFMLDPQGVITSWNPGVQRIKGYEPGEVLGRHFSIFYTPEDLEIRKPWRGLETAVREGRFEDEGWRVRKDGTYFWANVVITPLVDAEGHLHGFAKVTRDLTERRQSEEELRRSEELFRQTFDNAPIGISMVNLNYRFMRVNRALCDMLGYSAEELTGLTFVDVTHPDDIKPDLALADRLFRGEIPSYKLEKRYITKSGSMIWVEITVTVVRDRNGQPLHVLGMIEDISERKAAEEEIRLLNEDLERRVADRTAELQQANIELENEIAERKAIEQVNIRSRQEIESQRALLETVLETVPVAITLYDSSMNILNANSEQLRLANTTSEQLVDKNLYEVYPSALERKPMHDRVLAGEPVDLTGVRYDHPDFGLRYYDIRYRPMRDAEGKVLGLLSSSIDVTEQVVARQSVEDQRRLLETIIEGMPVGVAYYDTDMHIVNYNTEWARLSGLVRGDVRGISLYDLDPNTRERQHLHQRALEGEMISLLDVPHVQPNTGRTVYGDIHLRPVSDGSGRIVGLLSALVDSTLRHELDQAKDSFIALASHELKTPVTTIKGYAQSTLRNLDNYDRTRLMRTLTIINEQSNRITRLVNEMLDVSRMETQTLTFDHQLFDLREVISEVVSNQALVTPEFEISVQQPGEPSMVSADHQRIEQVLTNLVQNAVKYSDESRRIEVAAVRQGEEIVVSVRDFGVGIPAAQQSRVFQRFFRASNVSTSNYSGLGLGLFISHGIITRHGGRMWLESAEGEGSTFYFSLPLA